MAMRGESAVAGHNRPFRKMAIGLHVTENGDRCESAAGQNVAGKIGLLTYFVIEEEAKLVL